MEQEDDFLALGRDVPRQLDDPLLLVVLQIQGAGREIEGKGKIDFWQLPCNSRQFMEQIVFARIHFSPKLLSFHEEDEDEAELFPFF